MKDMNCPEEEI
jgi:hypothetical protein